MLKSRENSKFPSGFHGFCRTKFQGTSEQITPYSTIPTFWNSCRNQIEKMFIFHDFWILLATGFWKRAGSYQVVGNFRSSTASKKFAQTILFFFKPLYATFLQLNWHFIIRNTCFTLQQMEDLQFSMYRSQSIALSLTWGKLMGSG